MASQFQVDVTGARAAAEIHRTLARLRTASERAEMLGERYAVHALAFFSLIYFALSFIHARIRLLWHDELYTLYLSRIPSASELYKALLTGADQHPFAFYRVTHYSMAALGQNELGLRFPSIVFFWAACACLFVFVSRRTSRIYGLMAFLFPMVTLAGAYAIEARGYAGLLFGAALAMVCWDAGARGKRRKAALAGLAFSMALASAFHYYAVFLIVPFAAAELARSLRARTLDPPVWAAFAFLYAPVLLAYPFIRPMRAMSSHFWAAPGWSEALDFFTVTLGPSLPSLVAFALAIAFLLLFLPAGARSGATRPARAESLAAEDVALALGFCAIPFAAMLAAKLVTHAFYFRYVIEAVLGPVLLACILLYRLMDGRRAAAAAFVLIAGAQFVFGSGIQAILQDRATRRGLTAEAAHLASLTPADLPIAIGDPRTFMQLGYYASPRLKRRITYLSDPGRSLKYVDFDTFDAGMDKLRPWFQLNVVEYAAFLRRYNRFLVYTEPQAAWGWSLLALLDDGYHPVILWQNGSRILMRIDPPPASARSF